MNVPGESAATPSPRRVLVIDGDRRHLQAVSRVLRAVRAEVAVATSLGAHALDSFDLVITSLEPLAEGDRARLATLARSASRTRLLLFSDGTRREDFVNLFGERSLTNLVARQDELDAQDLFTTVQKLLRHDIFGIEKYFRWGAEPECHVAHGSSDKDGLVAAVERFARNSGVQDRMVTLLCTVADELLTNAIYNAPADASGKPRFAARSRTEAVALSPGEEVQLKLCCDGQRLGISVRDPFGSLSPDRVQDYLAKCMRRGDDQVDQKPGGAGLGLYYVFESLTHFVINICRGRSTEMIGIVDVRGSYREFLERSRSFNMFVEEAP